jgi:radical SAM-linked protein
VSEERQRLRLIFRKGDGARFLSHLDLMSTLEFALRRARLPTELSEGFNPRPRISLAAPLAVGHTGEREILEVTLRHPVNPTEVGERLQAALPAGITILSVSELPPEGKTAASRVTTATYRVELPDERDDLEDRAAEILARERIDVEEVRDGKIRRRDIRSMLLSVEARDRRTLAITTIFEVAGSARPEQILEFLGLPLEGTHISREEIALDE